MSEANLDKSPAAFTPLLTINVAWQRNVQVEIGRKVQVERDPYDEPVPCIGCVTGIRVSLRERVDIGQGRYSAILLVHADGGELREFDLEECFLTLLD